MLDQTILTMSLLTKCSNNIDDVIVNKMLSNNIDDVIVNKMLDQTILTMSLLTKC